MSVTAHIQAPLPAVLKVMAILVCGITVLVALNWLVLSQPDAEPLATQPRLMTNESLISELHNSAHDLAIDDPRAVFDFVLAGLPVRVKVYPTENYYYFNFLYGGLAYAGNLRLDASDRDAGKLHFTYFRQPAPWMGESGLSHLVLDRHDGVIVERLRPLVYRVRSGASDVVFELNDLSDLEPPWKVLLDTERYIGPVFDESGMRFFLIYNSRARAFHYVLDETVPAADRLAPTGLSDRILIGMGTGFAFYRDHRANRKILIGVHAHDEVLNTQLDGPFDQLPDNFIEGESLRSAILEVDPGLEGQIGRLGHYTGEDMRYLIGPYLRYRELRELAFFHDCAEAETADEISYAACFVVDETNQTAAGPGF